VGDLWVLRYHGNETDDGQGFTTNPALSRANIDKFVNGESVEGQDVVLWYVGHFMHDETHPDPAGHVVGPDLRPFNW
jgi:Cu2+-containing amine oxidase